MSSRDMDTAIESWLRRELDAVPEPDAAIHAAIRAASTQPQRRPRFDLGAWLSGRRRSRDGSLPLPPPETVLWGGQAPGATGSGSVPRRAQRALGMPTVLATMAIAVAAVTSLVLIVGTDAPGGDVGSLTQPRRGALALEAPKPEGRDILVAPDGSGHFWTIAGAVSVAVDGDRITVRPGTYHESVRITTDISISGEGGPEGVIVRPARLDDGQAVVLEGTGLEDFVPIGGDLTLTEVMPPGWRYVFHIVDAAPRISGLTIAANEVSSSVIVDGGSPTLEDLVIDPDGEQRNKDARATHESVVFRRGAGGVLQDSTLTAVASASDGSSPTISGNTVIGTCLWVIGPGSAPHIIGNEIEASQCPNFSIYVVDGAAPSIESNHIYGDRLTDGIRIHGQGTSSAIDGNIVDGALAGIWVGGGAEADVRRNSVTRARTGIKVVGATLRLDDNQLDENDVGIAFDERSSAEILRNRFCRNGVDLDLPEGASVAPELNELCAG